MADLTTKLARFLGSLSGRDMSPVYQATVTLTNDQIKALPTTAVTVVAAPSSDQVIVPRHGMLLTSFAAGAYTAAAGSSAWLYVDNGSGSAVVTSSVTPTQDILQSTTRLLKEIACPFLLVGAAGGVFEGAVVVDDSGAAFTLGQGRPLYIADGYGGVADYTGGNAANTLRVVVSYQVYDVTAGAFV